LLALFVTLLGLLDKLDFFVFMLCFGSCLGLFHGFATLLDLCLNGLHELADLYD
jgi:hypothetical protein